MGRRKIEIDGGERERLKAQPRRAGRRWGLLNVTSRDEAKVYVSGVLVGRTSIADLVS